MKKIPIKKLLHNAVKDQSIEERIESLEKWRDEMWEPIILKEALEEIAEGSDTDPQEVAKETLDEIKIRNKPYPMHFISSCGELYLNSDGSINEKSELSDYLLDVAMFDMVEFWSWEQRVGGDRDCGDSLELAYWDKDGVYYEPDWAYRKNIAHGLVDAKQVIEKQKAWIRTYRPVQNDETIRPQEKREPELRYIWVVYNVINWLDKKMTKVGGVFPPVVVNDIEEFRNAVGEMKEGEMKCEHYAGPCDGMHIIEGVSVSCSYSRCYMVTRKTDEEILKDFMPKWFVDDLCDELGNITKK